MAADREITVPVQLSVSDAKALATWLKRAGHSDYRARAVSDDEAYQMMFAGERVRAALTEKGVMPR